MKPAVHDLVPFAHVADVARSIAFYRRLGFDIADSLEVEGRTVWCFLEAADARLMLARADEPVDPKQQAVLFYLYSHDVAALREKLLGEGIAVSAITRPEHMPDGEIRAEDPDGYTLLIGQLPGRPSAPPDSE